MRIEVAADGLVLPGGGRVPCALGRGGIDLKRGEGDGITPIGDWPLRRVLYRADRVPPSKGVQS